jgi:hypothetical protein
MGRFMESSWNIEWFFISGKQYRGGGMGTREARR